MKLKENAQLNLSRRLIFSTFAFIATFACNLASTNASAYEAETGGWVNAVQCSGYYERREIAMTSYPISMSQPHVYASRSSCLAGEKALARAEGLVIYGSKPPYADSYTAAVVSCSCYTVPVWPN